MDNKVTYTIEYKTLNRKYKTTTKTFENETHYENWCRKMQNCGHKIIGTHRDPKNLKRIEWLVEDVYFQLKCFRSGTTTKEEFLQAMDEILHGQVEEPPIEDAPIFKENIIQK